MAARRAGGPPFKARPEEGRAPLATTAKPLRGDDGGVWDARKTGGSLCSFNLRARNALGSFSGGEQTASDKRCCAMIWLEALLTAASVLAADQASKAVVLARAPRAGV